MNTFCIIIVIVELIENRKLCLFKFLSFCQISRVYVACANLSCIIMEITPEILLQFYLFLQYLNIKFIEFF